MKKLILVTIFCLFATGALAETSGFQLSLTPDVAIQPKTTRIEGVTLSLWGENPQNALSLGFVNGSKGNSSGLSYGFLGNYAENYKGAQLGIGNYTSGKFTGFQWAAVNYAGTLNGLQLGFLNIAEKAEKGVQLGFINIIKETKAWFGNFPDEVAPAMVIANWRF